MKQKIQILSIEDIIDFVYRSKLKGFAKTDKNITLALDAELNDELIEEGIARELVNKLNTLRKEKGLDVQDRIEVTLEAPTAIKKVFEKHGKMIQHETLTTKVEFGKIDGLPVEINEHKTVIGIKKI